MLLTSTTRMGSLGVKLSGRESGSAATRAKAEGLLELGIVLFLSSLSVWAEDKRGVDGGGGGGCCSKGGGGKSAE